MPAMELQFTATPTDEQKKYASSTPRATAAPGVGGVEEAQGGGISIETTGGLILIPQTVGVLCTAQERGSFYEKRRG